ncbi:MAG: CARDB domain-containing protein [Candidatus Bipolaricaulota bacterium]
MSRRAVALGVMVLLGLSLGGVLLGAANLAELAIREVVLDPPSLVTRGTQLNVVAHVSNTGTRTAENFETGLYVRTQADGQPWTRLPGTIKTAYLSPADGRDLALSFAVETMDWQPGTYEIRAAVDLGDAIPETDELNNELIVVLTLVESPAGLADLQPVEIDFTPTDPADETAPWTVEVKVENAGDEAAGPFRVTLVRNGLAFATIPQFGLAKGGTLVVSGTLCGSDEEAAVDALACTGGLASGIYEIRALVDSGEEVAERDEQNNTLIGTLSVQALELRPKSLTFDRSPIRLNEDVTLAAVIENAGRGAADAVQVAFYVDGKQLDVVNVGPIGYLGEATAETVLNAARLGFSEAPDVYDVHVVVDPYDLLHETDEDNNELVRSLSIVEPLAELPELMPRSLVLYPASPVELGRADAVTITSTVLNSGRATATGFDVQFSYRSKGAMRWIPFPCADDAQCVSATLRAGQAQPFVGVLPTLALTPGVYEIRVVVDPRTGCDSAECVDIGRIAELDERNNELVTAFTLQAVRLPDIVACGVLVVDPSYAVRRGRSVTLSLCVVNEGDVASGPFQVRFSHCLTPEAPLGGLNTAACDTPAGFSVSGFRSAVVAVPALAAGQQTVVEARLETENLAPGTYVLNIELDYDAGSPAGRLTEANETNNVVRGALFVVGPDLAVVDLQIEPGSPIVQGTNARVSAILSNLGDEAAGQFDVSFFAAPLDGGEIPSSGCAVGSGCELELVTSALVPGLAADGFERVVCTLDTSALEPGTYVLRAEASLVDVPGKVDEHSIQNNVLEIPVVILPRPDLAFVLSGDPALAIHILPAPPVPAGVVAAVQFTVRNDGGTSAGTFRVVARVRPFFEDAEAPWVDFAGADVPGLAAGMETTLALPLLAPLVAGEAERRPLAEGVYEVCVLLDSAGAVAESDETDNLACTLPFALGDHPGGSTGSGGPVDLAVQHVHVLTSANDTASTWVVMSNLGVEAAGPFGVSFRIRDANGTTVEIVVPVEGLAAGTTDFRVDATFPTAGLERGLAELVITLDAQGVVAETDESNNIGTTAFRIR